MENYLKCTLTKEEEKLIRSIIWITARSYKKRMYERNRIQYVPFDEITMFKEDQYSFFDVATREEYGLFHVLNEIEKEEIVRRVDCVLVELSLYKFKIALTFDEKLVLFLCSFKKYSEKHASNLLNVKIRRIKYLKESLKIKKEKFLGGYKNV